MWWCKTQTIPCKTRYCQLLRKDKGYCWVITKKDAGVPCVSGGSLSFCNSLDPAHLIPRLVSASESGTIFPCTQAGTSRLQMPSHGRDQPRESVGRVLLIGMAACSSLAVVGVGGSSRPDGSPLCAEGAPPQARFRAWPLHSSSTSQ